LGPRFWHGSARVKHTKNAAAVQFTLPSEIQIHRRRRPAEREWNVPGAFLPKSGGRVNVN
jgi:hypothetical protein